MKKIGKAMIVFFMALAILLATNVPASARQGFFLGIQLPWNDIRGDFDNRIAPSVDPGLGFGLIFGYGITPNFSLETDLSVSSHNSAGATIDFTEWSVDAKFAFLAPQPIQPYILAGYGYYTLGDSSLTFGGYGASLGVGVDFYTIYYWSFGIGIIEKFITYDRIEKGYVSPPQPRDGETTTLRLDATFHF
jgi:hypothetical protein